MSHGLEILLPTLKISTQYSNMEAYWIARAGFVEAKNETSGSAVASSSIKYELYTQGPNSKTVVLKILLGRIKSIKVLFHRRSVGPF